MTPAAVGDIKGARALAVLGDSVTTDHISPAGNISKSSPAAKYLMAQGVSAADFNSYGARRGNHEVMMRGTFANIRLRNLLVPGTEGGVTVHIPSGEQMSIFDAAMKYKADIDAARDPRRQGIRHRQLARLGGQGHHAARRACGHRRELRAHPPLQSHRHGRAAAAIQGRRERADPRSSPARRRSTSSGWIAAPPKTVTVIARGEGGKTREFQARLRIDTPKELDYYRHGGILHYVLRQLAASRNAA